MGRSLGNRHKVPKKQWKKWDAVAQDMFNQIFMAVNSNQTMIHGHPKATKQTKAAWRTIAWNLAWIAADAANGRDVRETIAERR